MPGRRVLLLVGILLVSASVTALLAPSGVRRRLGPGLAGSAAPPERAAPGPPHTAGRIVRARVVVNVRRPPVVRARVGDLIELSVALGRPSTVALGEDRVESGDEDTPARFDFIADRAGAYGIHRLEDGRTVGRLVVSRRR